MPCEACNIQFTVFKRKKSCTECRRLYCSNCLTKNKERVLCKRCVIFTARPLSKIELLKLRAKDLIFYLQSKHISTTGCVEKEELVNLVLIHVDNSTNFSPGSQSSNPSFAMGTDQNDDLRNNPFDQIRNTCQNLFTTFTERIATDFNLDFKQNQNDPASNVCEDQPRYRNNSRSGTPLNVNESSSSEKSNKKYQRPTKMTSNDNPTINSSHSVSTPTASNSSSVGTPPQLQSPRETTTTTLDDASNTKIKHNQPSGSALDRTKPLCNNLTKLAQAQCCNESGSGCECSDDELILKFREKYCEPDHSLSPVDSGKILEQIDDQNPNNASTSSSSTKTKDDLSVIESSDISSFEDLGAVGGITMNENQNVSDADKWQIVSNPWTTIDDVASTSSTITDNKSDTVNNVLPNTTNLPNSFENNESPQPNVSDNQRNDQSPQQQQQQQNETFQSHSSSNQQSDLISKLEKSLRTRNTHRKVTRRQSDGIVYTATTSNPERRICLGNFIDRPDNDDDDADEDYSSNSDDQSQKRSPKSCHKCGKSRGDLKKYIERFRHQLETTTNFSETEIKRQLNAFLEFLENHDRNSFDSKDDDTVVPHSNNALVTSPTQLIAEAIGFDAIELEDYDDFDDEAGIHVYGSNDDSASSHPPRQFFDLNSIGKKQDLEELSVKQLKEILMLNRVDFKGCCEKSELLERVQRLWDDLQNCPAVDKLPTVDLCKICMDAAIECVLLECGHMATCTNCGKVLSECPICRQYIVRVVRFFKA